MPNSSALIYAILVGAFAFLVGYIAVQPAIQVTLIKLTPIVNEPFLIFVSKVLAYVVVPLAFARFIYLELIPTRRP